MAGASMRDIKRRQRSTANMQQITKALEMVSAAKLRHAEAAAIAARPFAQKLQEVLARLASSGVGTPKATEANPNLALLSARPIKRTGVALVTADRGLAGGYNANAIRKAIAVATDSEGEVGVTAIGRKGRDAMRRRGYELMREHLQIGDTVRLPRAREVARGLMEAYLDGTYDEVILVYTVFKSASSHEPVAIRLLPVEPPEESAEDASDSVAAAYDYEPSPEEVLGILIPQYVEAQVFRALLDAKASEHGARMVAMRGASDNADEILKALELSFNRARQASITREIAEIVGGANALSS